MTKYTVLPSKTFWGELRKLSAADQKRVLSKVEVIENNPFYPSLRTKKMRGDSGYYESSVNMDIRLIWYFDGAKIIVMVDVGHHDILNKY